MPTAMCRRARNCADALSGTRLWQRIGLLSRLAAPVLLLWTIGESIAYAQFPGGLPSREPSPEQAAALRDIVSDLEEFERLYDNIDVRLSVNYELESSPFSGVPAIRDTVIQRMADTLHLLRQGTRFRLSYESTQHTAEGARTLTQRRVCDGIRTQAVFNNQIVNLHTGSVEGNRILRPHMLLMYGQDYPASLSSYLKGAEAVAVESPSAALPDDQTIVSWLAGNVQWQEVPCYRVLVDFRQAGGQQPTLFRWELWLAQTRNYLPVRRFGYTMRWSADRPAAESEVTELMEVEPGIWFPLTGHTTTYRGDLFKTVNEQRRQWRRDYTVTSVELNPSAAADAFTIPPAPVGANVYEVARSGAVTHAHQAGSRDPGTTSPPPAERWRIGWIIANAVAAAVLLFLFWRRRKKSPSA